MALLGLKVPGNVSDMLNGIEVDGHRDKSDHLTMFYFEQELTVKDISKICKLLSPIIEKLKPFELMVSKVSTFPKGPDGVPVKADIKSKALEQLRKDIAKAFDDNKVKFSKTHPDFNPHVTLAYADDEIGDIKLPYPIKWVAHKLILWGGSGSKGGINVDIPLAAKITKASVLSAVSDKFKRTLNA